MRDTVRMVERMGSRWLALGSVLLCLLAPWALAVPGSDHVFPAIPSVVTNASGTPVTQTLTTGVLLDSYGEPLTGVLAADFTLSASFPSSVNVGGTVVNPGQKVTLNVDFSASGGRVNLPIYLPSGGTVGSGDYTLAIKNPGMVKWTSNTKVYLNQYPLPDGSLLSWDFVSKEVCKHSADLLSTQWCRVFPSVIYDVTSLGSELYVAHGDIGPGAVLTKLTTAGAALWSTKVHSTAAARALRVEPWKGSLYVGVWPGCLVMRVETDGSFVLGAGFSQFSCPDYGFNSSLMDLFVSNDKLQVSSSRWIVTINSALELPTYPWSPTDPQFSSTSYWNPSYDYSGVDAGVVIAGRWDVLPGGKVVASTEKGLLEVDLSNYSAPKTLHSYCQSSDGQSGSHGWDIQRGSPVADSSGYWYVRGGCGNFAYGLTSFLLKIRTSDYALVDQVLPNHPEFVASGGGSSWFPVKVVGNELVLTNGTGKLLGVDLTKPWRKPATPATYKAFPFPAARVGAAATLNGWQNATYRAIASSLNPLPGVGTTYTNLGQSVSVTPVASTPVVGPKVLVD